jgi:hypothetical protein
MADNATSPKPGGTVSTTPSNTPQHKLMAMGSKPSTGGGKPKK